MIKNLLPKRVYTFFYNFENDLKIISRITRENRLSILSYRTFLFIYLFIFIYLFFRPFLLDPRLLLPFLFCFFHVMVSRIRAYSKLLPIGEVFTSNWSFVSVSKTVSPIRDNVSCTLTRMYRPRNELFRGNASLIIFPPVHRLFFFFLENTKLLSIDNSDPARNLLPLVALRRVAFNQLEFLDRLIEFEFLWLHLEMKGFLKCSLRNFNSILS